MTEHERRYEAAVKQMDSVDALRNRSSGWLYGILSKIPPRYRFRPIHYMNFGFRFMYLGLIFGAFWGGAMYFIEGQVVFFGIAFYGIFMGLSMAVIGEWERQRYKLSKWKDL